MGLLQSKPKKKHGTASAPSSYSPASPTALTNELKPHVYGKTHGGKNASTRELRRNAEREKGHTSITK